MISDFRFRISDLGFRIRNQYFGFKKICNLQSAICDYKGFTLIETIIYVAIIGGIIATFISFSLNVSSARNKSYAQQETQANARVALNVITQKIQSASGVNLGSSVFNSDPGVLSLIMSSSTLNPTIISLSADDGSLLLKEGNNATTTITTALVQVLNLLFSNQSASSTKDNIGVDITVSFVSSTDVILRYTQALHTSVSTRE